MSFHFLEFYFLREGEGVSLWELGKGSYCMHACMVSLI